MEKEGWSRKPASWRSISTEAFIDFLRVTLEELTELTLRYYQIKQAQSYTEKHLREDGSYELFLWIEYNTDTQNPINSCTEKSKP